MGTTDDRFQNLLNNPAFAIDENDDDFLIRNPNKAAKRMRKAIRGDRESSDEENEPEDKGTWRENIKMTYKQVFDKKGAKQDIKKMVDNETVLSAKIRSSGKDLQTVDTLAEVKEVVEKKDVLIGERMKNGKNEKGIETGVTGAQEMSFKDDDDDI